MNHIQIPANSYKIGDEINGHKITGLGKIWHERVTDENACVYGLEPGLDFYPPVAVQYAYLAGGAQ